ncbi:PepSY domain-containing protein [Chiayiivirga flava]|uniref:Putative membrane protein YkoI n=1 Tax=Chiayiivirga flava TaxID=659595 RepID=A0A7W8D9R5_9GAMM|nr:PepSY domain-containing protein [Chiayiivirga flava]MBB5209387.1 putative membrane protein YkoI [Chiayiivirga flava]
MYPHRFRLAVLCALCLPPTLPAQPAERDDTVRTERDHERARQARASGAYMPLQSILDDAQRREPGRVVDVELDEDDDEYEIEILRADGAVVELDYDARTGDLRDREIEDDD